MADNVMGSAQLPPINLLSMLLEGPKGYFGRRGSLSDALWLQNQEQQQRGQFADSLIGSNVFKTAIANPQDRAAQYGLWALTEHGPQAIANQGANWLQSSLGAQNAYAQTMLEDRLARSRTSFSTDEQLRYEREKLNLQNQNIYDQFKQISGINPATGQPFFAEQQQRDMQYDFLAKQGFARERPAGYSVAQDGGFMPSVGSEAWGKSMDELSPIQQQNSAVSQLQEMINGQAPWDRGKAQALAQTIQDNIRKQKGFGSLDAGTAAALENYIPNPGGMVGQYNPTSNWALTAKEKLRALSIQGNQALGAWRQKWRLDPQGVGDPFAYGGHMSELPAPPKGSADAAIPAPKEGGSIGAGGAVSTWGSGGGESSADRAARKSRSDATREELKKKFPKAAW